METKTRKRITERKGSQRDQTQSISHQKSINFSLEKRGKGEGNGED